jgi:voltage-gated potassium channel
MSLSIKERLHQVIFEADTTAGRAFDVALLIAIGISVIVVVLESVPSIQRAYGFEFLCIEWGVTILFTVELLLRMYCVERPFAYATSFFGIVDILSIVPSFLGLLLPGMHQLSVIRVMRLLRVFRILKVARYVGASELLIESLRASRQKIILFMFAVSSIVVVIGALMHLVEGPESGFTDIPTGMYWAVVTLTTVGFGDITPLTPLGRMVASLVMIMGYGIIAVPTGIFSAEYVRLSREGVSTKACNQCGRSDHLIDALYCRVCGGTL